MLCSPSLCINLRPSVRWVGNFPCHSEMRRRSALSPLPITPTLPGRHGPDDTHTITTSPAKWTEWKDAVSIKVSAQLWRRRRRLNMSGCLWSAVPTSPLGPNEGLLKRLFSLLVAETLLHTDSDLWKLLLKYHEWWSANSKQLNLSWLPLTLLINSVICLSQLFINTSSVFYTYKPDAYVLLTIKDH